MNNWTFVGRTENIALESFSEKKDEKKNISFDSSKSKGY